MIMFVAVVAGGSLISGLACKFLLSVMLDVCTPSPGETR